MQENNKRDNYCSLMKEQQKPISNGTNKAIADKAKGKSKGSARRKERMFEVRNLL